MFRLTYCDNVNHLKDRIIMTSIVYEVGSCGENEKNQTYTRCKREGYKGVLVFAKTADREEAVGALKGHCASKGHKNIVFGTAPDPSCSGWVYVAGKNF